jgi:hypothetical protein
MTSAIPFNPGLMQSPECTLNSHMPSCDLHEAVNKAYITALLLTASAERAEAAILRASLPATDVGGTLGEALVRGALNAAIKAQADAWGQPPEDLERASSMLPLELQRVLRLSSDYRQCFVLRFLIGLPREVCARLLRLEIGQVDERARMALLELPAIQRQQKGQAASPDWFMRESEIGK